MYEDTAKWRKEVDIDQLVKPKSDGGYDFEEREIVASLGWKMCKWERETDSIEIYLAHTTLVQTSIRQTGSIGRYSCRT